MSVAHVSSHDDLSEALTHRVLLYVKLRTRNLFHTTFSSDTHSEMYTCSETLEKLFSCFSNEVTCYKYLVRMVSADGA